MTADKYFQIALPTREDFTAWTKSIFARADELNARLERKYPHLYGAKRYKGEFSLEDEA